MTFKEALAAKEKFNKVIIDCTYIFKTVIVPRNGEDLDKYITAYMMSDFDDNSAKKYSKDQSYMICSIWTDGRHVFKKVLKK